MRVAIGILDLKSRLNLSRKFQKFLNSVSYLLDRLNSMERFSFFDRLCLPLDEVDKNLVA